VNLRSVAVALVAAVLAAGLGSCGQFVEYTDDLRDPTTRRTLFVRSPATIGGVVGFAVGTPVSVAALPVTYVVYSYQKAESPDLADPLSTLLFPSFVLWRTVSLIAAPFDALEFLAYRAWLPPRTPTREEVEQMELEFDERSLQSYPVRPIYPLPSDGRSDG